MHDSEQMRKFLKMREEILNKRREKLPAQEVFGIIYANAMSSAKM